MPAETPTTALHALRVLVKMIGPVTQPTDLQAVCVLKQGPAGDRYIEAMADFSGKLGGMLSSLRDRGETLLCTPPAGAVAPRRVLPFGVGGEATLSARSMSAAGRITALEALKLGAAHVSWAPTMRARGSTRLDVGDGDRAFAEGLVLAYDTAKRLQAQQRPPAGDVSDLTIEAGPRYYADADGKVRAGAAAATVTVAKRHDTPYVAPATQWGRP